MPAEPLVTTGLLDEDDMASNSATRGVTQQSVVAFVETFETMPPRARTSTRSIPSIYTGWGGSNSNVSNVAGDYYVYPMCVPLGGVNITEATVTVQTASTSGVVEARIYQAGAGTAFWTPQGSDLTSGAISLTTATAEAVAETGLDIDVPQGWHLLLWSCDETASLSSQRMTAPGLEAFVASGTNGHRFRDQIYNSTSWTTPATLGAGSSTVAALYQPWGFEWAYQ